MTNLSANIAEATNRLASSVTSKKIKEIRHYKHLFFDLDDTLTLSKSLIEPQFKDLLIASGKTIIVVSGQEITRIQLQTDNLHTIKLGQNGNFALLPDGTFLWKEVMTVSEIKEVLSHVSEMQPYMGWDVKNPDDLIEDRGCQVSFSMIGHNEDVPYKRAFDPNSEKRIDLLNRVPFTSETVEVKIGGTTTFDYFKRGYHKGYNVIKLIEVMQWNKEDCVYFGDKLHPGGNDESVIGVIDTIAVTDHNDTYNKLKASFG